MSEDNRQSPAGERDPANGADDTVPVATVAGGVLRAFFDELEKSEDLQDKATKLRALVLDDGIMAEPAIRAILFPEA